MYYLNIYFYRYKFILNNSSETVALILSKFIYVLKDKMLFVLYYFDIIMVCVIVVEIIVYIIKFIINLFPEKKSKKNKKQKVE